jgi:phosphoinositide-3-kinase regulatory subunit 4
MVALESSKSNPDGSAAILLEVWDVEKTLLMETYGTRKVQNQNEEVMQPAEVVGETTDENPAAAIAALVRSRQQSRKSQDRLLKRPQVFDVPLAPSPDIRAIVVGRDFGGSSTIHRSGPTELVSNFNTVERATDGREFLVTGSEDRKLRLWDLNRVERTAILSGFENETEKPSYE